MTNEYLAENEIKSSINLIARFAGIILAPQRTLRYIIDQPTFWQPFLVISIAFIGIRLATLSNITDYYASSDFKEAYIERRGISVETAAKEIDILIKTAPLIIFLEAPLTILIGTLGVAGLFHLIGIIGFGKRIRYRQIFCVTAWCSVISAFPMLLNIPLRLINMDWHLPTSLSIILSPELVGAYFSHIVSIVDLFLIWQAWLFSIGLSLLYGISLQRAVGVVGTLFISIGIFNAVLFNILQ